jgi:hypothetical protein
VRSIPRGSTPSAGPSHKLLETHFYLVLRQIITDLIQGKRPAVDIEPYRWSRFGILVVVPPCPNH